MMIAALRLPIIAAATFLSWAALAQQQSVGTSPSQSAGQADQAPPGEPSAPVRQQQVPDDKSKGDRGAQKASKPDGDAPASAVTGVNPGQAPHQDRSPDQGGQDGKGEDPDHDAKRASWRTFFDKISEDPVAFFTVWVAIFTGVLAWSTIGLWRQTRRLAEQAVEASKDTKQSIAIAKTASEAAASQSIASQVAVIGVINLQNYTAQGIGSTVQSRTFSFRCNIVNSGVTHALNCSIRSQLEITNENIYVFDPASINVDSSYSLDPRSQYSGPMCIISLDQAVAIFQQRAKCFFYNRVDYEDIFGNKHHNEKCVQILFIVDPTGNLTAVNNEPIQYFPIGRQNTAS